MKQRRLTADQARRIALAAQGFTTPRPNGRVDVRHFRRVLDRVGLIQLDSVNVLERSHYLPMFSRLGPYDRSAFDRWTARSGELFEYWGHEASLIPVGLYSTFGFRMDEMKPWGSVRRLLDERPGYVEGVLQQVADRGPITVSDLEDPGERGGPWWGYAPGKHALEWLFAKGEVTAYRTRSFGRIYDLPERVRAGVGDAAAAAGRDRGVSAPSRRCCAPPWGRDRGRSRRLPPAPYTDRPSDPRRPRGRGGRRSCRRRWMAEPRLPSPGGRPTETIRRDCPPQPVRFSGLEPGSSRTYLRIPVPHRDLRSEGPAAVRATTCCRSSSTASSWLASTSRPIARGDASSCRPHTSNPAASPLGSHRPLRPSSTTMASWLDLDEVEVARPG